MTFPMVFLSPQCIFVWQLESKKRGGGQIVGSAFLCGNLQTGREVPLHDHNFKD